jgi:hypothetical protein
MHALARIDYSDDRVNSHRSMKVIVVAMIVLLFAASTAIGSLVTAYTVSTTDVDVDNDSNDVDDRAQSVTMKIDVDADDVLDLDMARGDVVVDTWDGDDVLVIVEKSPAEETRAATPTSLNIKVTRNGNNVRIATLDMMGQPFSN